MFTKQTVYGSCIKVPVYTTHCVHTQVWTVTGNADGNLLISGGADSLICFWQDVTEQIQLEEVSKQQQLLLRYVNNLL